MAASRINPITGSPLQTLLSGARVATELTYILAGESILPPPSKTTCFPANYSSHQKGFLIILITGILTSHLKRQRGACASQKPKSLSVRALMVLARRRPARSMTIDGAFTVIVMLMGSMIKAGLSTSLLMKTENSSAVKL